MIPKDVRTVSAQYETFIENVMRENEHRKFAQEIRESRPRWYAHRVDWLLCELDYRRVVLAERLANYELAKSILRGEETTLFSAGRCT